MLRKPNTALLKHIGETLVQVYPFPRAPGWRRQCSGHGHMGAGLCEAGAAQKRGRIGHLTILAPGCRFRGPVDAVGGGEECVPPEK